MTEQQAAEPVVKRAIAKNPEKAKAAAAHPDRTGEGCKAEPLTWWPVVDLDLCTGQGDCEEVCPYRVFLVGVMGDEEFAAQPAARQAKLLTHDRRIATTPAIDDCRACGMCVVGCPERAITLVRREG